MAEKYNLEDYETVELRLRRLYAQFPEARVLTEMVFRDERSFIVKAELYLDREDMTAVATGYAEEIVGAGFVNKTSALENCETSAIGRAISNSVLILGAPEGKRPSQQEMQKVERYKAEPRKPVKPKKEYTADDISGAASTIALVATIDTVDRLRELWQENVDYLDVPAEGTTIKDVINARVKEIQSAI